MLNLEDYILESIPVSMYYDTHIKPIDAKRFKDSSLTAKRTAICPLHDDSDPSFGLIKDKFKPNVHNYHCFGCNASGNVIRLHQRIQLQYFGNDLTYAEAQKDLARLYPDLIDLTQVVEIDESNVQVRFMKSRLALKRASNRYTIRTYSDDLMSVRKERGSIPLEEQVYRINNATIKLLVTEKGLIN